MSDKAKNQSWYMVGLVFVILAMALVGTIPSKYYIKPAQECSGGEFMQTYDEDCADYPYEDGNGDSATPVNQRFTEPQDHYVSPYDWLRVDVQSLIDKSGGIPSLGLPGSIDNEVKVFCFFDANGAQDFTTIINKLQLTAPGFDFSASTNLILNLCYTFPPYSHGITELPVLFEEV